MADDAVEAYPDGLLVHAYTSPVTAVAPIEAELPEHIVALVPAIAAGRAFTVMETEFEAEQPVAVTVSVTV